MSRTPHEELVHFLSDMYSVEEQALAQMKKAPDLAGDPSLANDFQQHYTETLQQAELVRARLEAHGGTPSKVKDAIMKLGGKSFLLFAQVQPETPGRLVVHAYSYEAMEWAGYEMLLRFAERAGDPETAEISKTIRDEERTMMERLERGFDAAERASHADTEPENMDKQLRKHLAEAHALEVQGLELLKKSEQIASDSTLETIYRDHLELSMLHSRLLDQRLDALGGDSSGLKDSALKLGGLNWSIFFQAQSDTAAKLAAFVYAVIHLQIGGLELLKRSAARASEAKTIELCDTLVREKHAMADRLAAAFDSAIESTLAALQS